jgi:hypothetical protein
MDNSADLFALLGIRGFPFMAHIPKYKVYCIQNIHMDQLRVPGFDNLQCQQWRSIDKRLVCIVLLRICHRIFTHICLDDNC